MSISSFYLTRHTTHIMIETIHREKQKPTFWLAFSVQLTHSHSHFTMRCIKVVWSSHRRAIFPAALGIGFGSILLYLLLPIPLLTGRLCVSSANVALNRSSTAFASTSLLVCRSALVFVRPLWSNAPSKFPTHILNSPFNPDTHNCYNGWCCWEVSIFFIYRT